MYVTSTMAARPAAGRGVAVERMIMAIMIAGSTVAVLTTIGIVLSLVVDRPRPLSAPIRWAPAAPSARSRCSPARC
jgi:hypothetical protein